MADLKRYSLSLLSTTTGVDVNGAIKINLYTVPVGYIAYITHVVVRDPSASMAGGNDFDLGTGAGADTWKTTVDLSALVTLGTDYAVINLGTGFASESAASSEFGIIPITGTTAACTVTIDVFGYLV